MLHSIIKYLNIQKWYSISIITINALLYLCKLFVYKYFTDIADNTIVAPINQLSDKIITFSMQLFAISMIGDFVQYMVKKAIIASINDFFTDATLRIINNDVDSIRKDNSFIVNQLWTYMHNMKKIMYNLFIDLPQIAIFTLFYIYTIYAINSNILSLIIPINIFILFMSQPLAEKQRKLYRKSEILDANAKNKMFEAIVNIEFVKLNNCEKYESIRICNSFETYAQAKTHGIWTKLCFRLMSNAYNSSALLVICLFGMLDITNADLNMASILYLIASTLLFHHKLIKLKDIYNCYAQTEPHIEFIFNNACVTNTGKDNNANTMMILEQKKPTGENIIYKNVSFSYDGETNVINNLSFEFIGNKINLLLGPNGSGKSTLIKLLLRLYNLENTRDDSNIIYFQGLNIKNMNLNDLRKRIVFVQSEPCIFNESIMYNIKYGIDMISDERIAELCDIIHSRHWLLQNKHKNAGLKGKNLSGGEKKKIQIINAMCRRSDVIIFDEPTNTLDVNALIWFYEFVKLLRDTYNKTIIIITHDMRLKDICDNIIDLNEIINSKKTT